ncbi:MAG: peptide chain release factor N(5)-glutamine methyltransferase [Methylomonas sp.]
MVNSVTALLDQAYQQLAAVSDSALLDAEVLLCHCLDKNRSFIRAWPEHQLTDQQAAEFLALITQRQQGVPVAYLTGEREFWSRSFKVNPDVLIPRPDSELLIELSLDLLPANQVSKIIDLGTGSGILAITLAAERPASQVIACDLSPAALRTAQDNAQQLQIANVRFLASNWFSAITERDFDLVISNPPYIDQHDPHLQQGDVRFEPDSALISLENGLQDIRLLADQARQHLKPSGYLLIEHGYDQQTAVQALFKRFNYQQITTHLDYAGNPRVTSGQWSPA